MYTNETSKKNITYLLIILFILILVLIVLKILAYKGAEETPPPTGQTLEEQQIEILKNLGQESKFSTTTEKAELNTLQDLSKKSDNKTRVTEESELQTMSQLGGR